MYYINEHGYFFQDPNKILDTTKLVKVTEYKSLEEMNIVVAGTWKVDKTQVDTPYTIAQNHYVCERGFKHKFDGTPENFISTFIIEN